MRCCLFAVIAVYQAVVADIAVTVDARKELRVTVYRDFGIVRDVRKINIPEGDNRIRFEGVATGIEEESVNLEWKSGEEVELIAQAYEFDLVSPVKLMEKYIGRQIEIVPGKDQWPDTSVQPAELISINGKEPVYRIGAKITFGNIGRILFPYMPDNLYTIPTLVWNVAIPRRQSTEIAATYLTEGCSWEAGYLLQVENDQAGSFGGWINFTNESGLDFKNALITFVAGDVRRFDKSSKRICGPAESVGSYGDFFFYEMNQPISIFSNHAKQVEWIPKGTVQLRQNYLAEIDFANGIPDDPVNVYASVVIENLTTNGLGIPLPKGIVRVFKRDAGGENRFIGENLIPDTRIGQPFLATVGKTEGITVSIKSASDGEAYRMDIANNKPGPVSLRFKVQTGGRNIINASGKYRIVQNSSVEWDLVIKSHDVAKIACNLKKRGS